MGAYYRHLDHRSNGGLLLDETINRPLLFLKENMENESNE
jgi:hypothetical protein